MRPDELFALASAHGIDLEHAARIAGDPAKRPRKEGGRRNRFGEEKLEEGPGVQHGTPTASSDRPEWTVQEIALGSQGLPDECFWAALYAFSGDDSKYAALHDALAAQGRQIARRERWSRKIQIGDRQRYYIDDLAELVLDDDRHPEPFRQSPELYAIVVGVTVPLWQHSLRMRYEALRFVWLTWLDTAKRAVRRRLNDEEVA